MSAHLITLKEFQDNFSFLMETKNDMAATYDELKAIIQASKENHIPLIGNPLIRIQNSLIELSYLLKLHSLNCKVYQELIAEEVDLDQSFIQQLNCMLDMTKEISVKFGFLRERLVSMPLYDEVHAVAS